MPNLKDFVNDHPETETQVWEEIAAKVVDEWNKVPLINPVTPQELERAILCAEKR